MRVAGTARAVAAGLALAAAIACGPAALAARGDDPDWPCVQRLVPRLDAGSLWTGPALPQDDAWRAEPDAAALVARITPRAVTEEAGLGAIADFAAPLDPAARRRLLPLGLAGLLAETNRQRGELIDRIKAFAHRQRDLAEAVNRLAAERDALPPASPASAEVEQRYFFAAKAFQDTERTLRYACELPVRLEARLGAYARALEAALPRD